MTRQPNSAGADDTAAGKTRKLIESTSTVGGMTFLSRISGLVREAVFARVFGAGPLMDAFFVAFKIPNLLRRFFAEGAFAQAFVPIVSEYRKTRSADETREMVARAAGTLGIILFAITAVGVVLAPTLILVFATGFADSPETYAVASQMLRLTFPYILFISLTALAGGVLNTYGRFAVPAFTPVLLNLVLIGCALWLAPSLEQPVLGLAVGVFLAGLVQLLFQLPFVWRAGMLGWPRWGLADDGVRRIARLMGPAILGSSVAQINILFGTWIASFLAAGSISWLYYSDRLVEFPLGVFGVALATVILPNLSAHHAEQSAESFSVTLDWAVRCVVLIGLPAMLGLILLAEATVTTLYYGGQFTAVDVEMSVASLRAYAPGLMAFMLVKVLAPGFFARQDTATPVRIGVRALLLGMSCSVLFVLLLRQTGWAPPHAGLAAATAVSGFANAIMLYLGLRRAGVYRPEAGWLALIARAGAASIAMVAFLWWLDSQVGDWLALTLWAQIGWLAAAVGGGAAIYFAAAWLAGLRPADFLMR